MKWSCIIIEDEPLASDLMAEYIGRIDSISLQQRFDNAIAALIYLNDHHVDLIFLDLHLPKLKGLDFVRKLKNPPAIIVTTAYHQYALESYELPVIDYLLKPIEFPRFEQAINKLFLYQKKLNNQEKGKVDRSYKFIRIGNRELKVFLDEVLYIESELEYLKIFRKNNAVVRVRHTMQSIQKELNPLPLVRIHRSFLVVIDKVNSISSKEVGIDEKRLPIGRQYRAEALKILRMKS